MSITAHNLGSSSRRGRSKHGKSPSIPPRMNGATGKPAVDNAIRNLGNSPKSGKGRSKSPGIGKPIPKSNGATKGNGSVRFATTGNQSLPIEHRSSGGQGKVAVKFKIGMQVGLGLGECYLQLQKLEHSVSKLMDVSDDVKGVLSDLVEASSPGRTQSDAQDAKDGDETRPKTTRTKGGRPRGFTSEKNEAPNLPKQRSQSRHNLADVRRKKDRVKASTPTGDSSKARLSVDYPAAGENGGGQAEDCLYITELLERWQRDVGRRMKSLATAIMNLQATLQDLDDAHSEAGSRGGPVDRSEMDETYRKIGSLQSDLSTARAQLREKDRQIKDIRRSFEDRERELQQKEQELQQREEQLDMDAEAIVKQTNALRSESEKLIAERADIRKQKDHWQRLVDEQSLKAQEVAKRAEKVEGDHEKLMGLHSAIAEERKKLNKARRKMKKMAQGGPSQHQASPQTYYSQRSGYAPSDYAESAYAESAYAESEYAETVATESEYCPSVNSISDDEREELERNRQKVNRLEIPVNPYG